MEDTRARSQEEGERLSAVSGPSAATRAEPAEDAAFLSGAALARLDLAAASADLPHPLWRARLALGAAVACAGLAGRAEGAAALRDAVHLRRPGDRPGPAGEICLMWMQAVARPISAAALKRAAPVLEVATIAQCLAPGRGDPVANPVARAAGVLEAALAESPRAEAAALILADAALSRAMGWEYLVPLLAAGLAPRDLRRKGEALRLACHRAIPATSGAAAREAAELTRRAGALRRAAPKLRARGAAEAVALFLSRDALAPAALAGLMSNRAARRLCDRLVALDALRELTGRASFRLYGV
jgi:hypothetical protein